jgi:DNA-binding LacI/PurR family transcriptional regulator
MPAKRTRSNSPSPSKPTRLVDVARAAGVSVSVAGQVLNRGGGNSRASPETVERILAAGKKLDYQPNHAARQLRGKRSQTFGVMVASAGDPLRSFLVQYLDAEAVRQNCRTLITNTVGNLEVAPDQFSACAEDLSRRGVDGVFCAVHRWFEGDRAALLKLHPNTVFYEDPGVPDAAYVTVDRAEAARLAVRHLVERGRRRIGLALMTLSRPAHAERLRGYREELSAAGLKPDKRLVFNGQPHGLIFPRHNAETGKWDFDVKKIDLVIDQLVCEQRADAIITHDDFWAAALLRRMRARGIRVPSDVAVVGYLNHYLSDWTDPPLTTIDLSHATAAKKMVEMMERIIADGSLPKKERMALILPKLIVREST